MLNDPTVDLLREVAAWPGDSPTSHVLVAQLDGQNIVYLVPVPGLSQKPFLRLPLSTPNLNSAKAFLHGDFVHEGTDFRGIRVLAAARKVAALPWVVVAKTDTAEAMAPLQKRMRRIGLIFGGAILVSIVLVFAVWRGQRAALAATVRHYETEREAMTRHADALVRHARDAILLIGADGHIIEANEAAEALYGYPAGELARLTIRDLRGDDDPVAFDHQWAAASSAEGALFETVHRRKDGTLVDVEVSSRSIDVEGRNYHQSFIRDISRRKVLERQVERLLRIERALQLATGVLLRSTSEQELYQRMCGIVVDIAGYRMAFVALANDDPDRTVTMAAIAGHEAGFFAVRVPVTWAEGNTSVTGTAIRTGEIQVNQDYATNPNVAAWRDEAMKRGFQSSIALPIRDGTRVIGVLGLTSAERHAFDAQEVGLLATLADDVSYGVATLRARGRGDGD
jgi:PAS domain S-box-containing protein